MGTYKICHLLEGLTLYHAVLLFSNAEKKALILETCGKRRNAQYQHFLLFPQCFLPYQRQKSPFELPMITCLKMILIWSKPFFFFFLAWLTLLPHDPDYEKRELSKTLREKERMLVTSIFCFSLNVLFPIKEKFFAILATFKLSSANALNFDQCKILLCGKRLTLSQTSPDFFVSAVQVF